MREVTAPSAPLPAATAVVRPWLRAAAGADETAMTLGGVLERGFLAGALAADRARRGADACPRAAASLWSKQLMSALLPGPALAALAGGSPPSPAILAVADGVPKAMIATPPESLAGAPAAAALGAWVADVVGDAAHRLASECGLSPRVFRSNAATMAAYLCEQWERIEGVAERAGALRRALLDEAGAPFAREITYVTTPVPAWPRIRRRRICCLRDRVGMRLCASCPKIPPDERDAILRTAAR